jgi:hypothetical protein
VAQDSGSTLGDLVIFIIISCSDDFVLLQYYYVLVYSFLSLF